MPYRDPHTAAPCLWAHKRETGREFEVSTTIFSGSPYARKGLECLLTYEYRLEKGTSPPARFGPMIHGYTMSSYRKEGIRGQKIKEDMPKTDPHPSSIPALSKNFQCVTDSNWMNQNWSPPTPLQLKSLRTLQNIDCSGLYRIWIAGQNRLVYVGESQNLKARLTNQARKAATLQNHDVIFSFARRPELDETQLWEAECDLIGAHFKALKEPPCNQFKQDIFQKSNLFFVGQRKRYSEFT